MTPWGIVVHTAVSNSQNIRPVWMSSDVESHFYVNESGTIYQYMDTERVAHCQRSGNFFGGGKGHISIETWDGAGKVWDGKNTNKIPRWNDAQVKALVRLFRWLRDTHGIPIRPIPSWDGRGIGYHRQFSQWNKSHACPGPARIAQLPEIIALAANGSTEEDELAGAVDTIVARIAESQKAVGTAVAEARKALAERTQKQYETVLQIVKELAAREDARYQSLLKNVQQLDRWLLDAQADVKALDAKVDAKVAELEKKLDELRGHVTTVIKTRQETGKDA